jgi:hypothetical protein
MESTERLSDAREHRTVADLARPRRERGTELRIGPEPVELSPGRWQFADMDDLVAYLESAFDVTASDSGGVTGRLSRKGSYIRRRPDGTRALTFGEPVLDQVTSPLGELVIGGQVENLARDGGLLRRTPAGSAGPSGPIAAGSDLVLTGEDNAVERWASEDGSKVEYRSGTASLTFRAWKKKQWTGYWSMGAEITTSGTVFEAARIDSRYYDTFVAQVCGVIYDNDSDTNDDHLDEYEWGWNSSQPHRVESLCRAQWNGERYADVVVAGNECFAPNVEPWPTGWPDDWPPDAGAEVRPRQLGISVRSVGVVGRATATIVNHDPVDMVAVVEEADGPLFSNPTGTFTIGPNGTKPITVTFAGAATGVYTSRLRIQAGGRFFNVPITATVTQVGEPL